MVEMLNACPDEIDFDVYQPRNPKASAYYRCVEEHFEQLEAVWDERYQLRFGFWRPYVTDVLQRYLVSSSTPSRRESLRLGEIARYGCSINHIGRQRPSRFCAPLLMQVPYLPTPLASVYQCNKEFMQ